MTRRTAPHCIPVARRAGHTSTPRKSPFPSGQAGVALCWATLAPDAAAQAEEKFSSGGAPLFLGVNPGLMGLDGLRDGRDGTHRFSRDGGVGNLNAVAFVQRDDQFEGVHGVQSQTARSEERLVVANFLRSDLQHEVFDQEAFDLGYKLGGCVHGGVAVGVFKKFGLTNRAAMACKLWPVMLTLAATQRDC